MMIPVYIDGVFARFVTHRQQPREIGGRVLPKRPNVHKLVGAAMREFRVVATASRVNRRGESVWAAHYTEVAV